eukprot:COSAG01_NODE_7715_length_3048_cov_7.664324_5_plen_91_part_00
MTGAVHTSLFFKILVPHPTQQMKVRAFEVDLTEAVFCMPGIFADETYSIAILFAGFTCAPLSFGPAGNVSVASFHCSTLRFSGAELCLAS